MLELEIRCGYSQAPMPQGVKVGTFTHPSTRDDLFTDEGVQKGLALTLWSTGACEYPHLIEV